MLTKERFQCRQLLGSILERLGKETKISSICSSAKDSLRFDVKRLTDIMRDLWSSRGGEAENPLCFDFLREPSDFARLVSRMKENRFRIKLYL